MCLNNDFTLKSDFFSSTSVAAISRYLDLTTTLPLNLVTKESIHFQILNPDVISYII